MDEDKLDAEDSPANSIEIKNEKKLTTKLMIIDALTELNTRKGVSVYAIKKHLAEKHQVTEKLNFLINKTLKSGVEDGTFLQLKGIGASGSFKLPPKKKSNPKNKKGTAKIGDEEKEGQKKINKIPEKSLKKPPTKKEIPKTKQKITDQAPLVKVTGKLKGKEKSVEEKKKKPKVTMEEKDKKTKSKVMKEGQTPAKKKSAMMRRKSSGSIIKPPKMKPRSK